MNEQEAREALLIRAYETASVRTERIAWDAADRDWASREALRVEGEAASADRWVARRARLAAERLFARDPAARRIERTQRWPGWIGWGAATLALLAGVAADAVGATGRINLLAPPQLLLLAWNLALFAWLGMRAARALAPGAGPSAARAPAAGRGGPGGPIGSLASALVAAARRVPGLTPGSAPEVFVATWQRASGHLNALRLGRVLHVGAAMLALGTIAGLYLRGLAFEYRAGWESTFLDAATVRALLSPLLGPAAALTGIELPDAEGLARLRFPQSDGENAAPWIHLWATTLGIAVVLPRALLAALAWRAERRLSARFPLALDDPYFGALVRAGRGMHGRARIVPYSMHLEPAARDGLRALVHAALGAGTEVLIESTVAYGDEDAFVLEPLAGPAPVLCAALFSLAATAERESHGAFARALADQSDPRVPVVVLVDESAFRRRFGDDDGGRLDARRQAWRRLLDELGIDGVLVDLGQPTEAEEQALLRAIEHAGMSAPARAAGSAPRTTDRGAAGAAGPGA